ncbi:TatD family hydrolase [Aquimarina agarilytica]|uniref:TatD family hydrolase n=1 Tax=Aquimarina agarilytica TaxID=1087449 RepID=UPI00028976FD|nr:TatD family hydrolase [Aquimarina agarilytica]
MILTDTHTHLNSEAFAEDRNLMIQRAIDKGVSRLFVPSVDSETTKDLFEVQQAFPNNVFLMMGLHPTHVKENYLAELAHVEEQLEKHQFCAVGEIGMDLYWDKTYINEQKNAFEKQIALAKKHQLPINIHCRDAFNETFEILEKHRGEDLHGIFHCFTGTYEQALQAINCGMKLGIGGVSTFKNGKIDQFLNKIDIAHIVLETDAPYLAPTPFRGKRNESSYIYNIAEKIADIYQLPVEKIAALTTQNSKEVYGM